MNIGETDADGWTYVRFGDAAKAAQEGTHEVLSMHNGYKVSKGWSPCVDFKPGAEWQYRIRVKARTITVTIPRPDDAVSCGSYSAQVVFYDRPDRAVATINAIRAAMETQP